MKHLVISDYGTYLGVSNGLLSIKSKDSKKAIPLNRMATISIAKRGVSLSSDLIEECSSRGMQFQRNKTLLLRF